MIRRMATPQSARTAEPSAPGEPTFAGEFETHVTVDCDEMGFARLESWAAQAASDGIKLTHILLGRGRVRSQPMLTLTGTGTLPDQRDLAAAIVRDLTSSGLRPIRVKIEAAPWNSDVPQDGAAALQLGQEFYFEHHVKLALSKGADLEALAALVIPHSAHLSWNARRTSPTGGGERFATQRCHNVGLPEAGTRLDRMCDELREHGYQILSTVQEFVVFDSDVTLDAGWIEQVQPSVPSAVS